MSKTPQKKQPSQSNVPTAKEKLTELLALLKIKIVYYVDDENNLKDLDIAIVHGEVEKIYNERKEQELKNIAAIQLDPDALPKEGIVSTLTQQWLNLQLEIKKRIYDQLIAISKPDSDNMLDFKRSSLVGEQIPVGIVKVLSPSEWDIEKKNLKTIVNEENRALILFDEILKYAGGRFEVTKGQDLILEVKKMGLESKAICALLTNKTTTKEELDYRDRVIKHRKDKGQEELEINDFFPLGKERLDNPEIFADGIKKALINTHIETIKQNAVEVLQKSYAKAIDKIKSFDTYDFEEAILKSSHKDGVWEPETIVRISDIAFENELKKVMKETDFAFKVNPHLKAALQLGDFNFQIPDGALPYSQKYKLRHYEIYDNGEVINYLRKPLENGDIFQLDNSKFILVAQPCDMAVRKKDGTLGMRSAKTATLLKITHSMPRAEFEKKLKDGHYLKDLFPLEYFVENKKDVGIVDFKESVVVDIDYLDFCVFDEKGECKIRVDKGPDPKPFVSKPWEARFDLLVQKISKVKSTLLEVQQYMLNRENKLARKLIRMLPRWARNLVIGRGFQFDVQSIEREFYPRFVLASSLPLDNIVKIESDGTFNFGIKRISKFKDPGATYLLDRYTRHLSRTAEAHDFAFDKRIIA